MKLTPSLKRLFCTFLSAAAVLALAAAPVSAAESRRLLNPPSSGGSGSSGSGGSIIHNSGASITVKSLNSVAKDYNVSEDFLDEIAKKKSITQGALKQYAVKYQLPVQYVQRFFDDCFVFKSGTNYQYLAINDSLAKNTYDWDNIVKYDNNEWKYIVNGRSKAYKGIDVSEFQGEIDWKKVKADGVKFAFIRLGYRGYGTGKLVMDQYFHQNMKNAIAAGIDVGVYFYSQATSAAEAVEEAELVLQEIRGYDLAYPVVFDIEDAPSANARTAGMSATTATNLTRAFCDTIANAGYRPMIYTNSRWFASRLDLTKLKSYDKWLAQYYVYPFFPYKFQILQYTHQGRVNGIKGNVDLNLCFVNYNG